MSDIEYKKEYLPGYTGHVPKKNDIYGCTAGDINKIIAKTSEKPSNYDVDVAVGKPTFATREFYSKPPASDKEGEAVQFGNNSKLGNNWLGGPTANLKAQHIPGYSGYVPQIKSENLYGKSFAKATGAAINGEYNKGQVPPLNERFQTAAQAEYGKDNFRRLKNDVEPAELKDQRDAGEFHDAEQVKAAIEFQGIEVKERSALLDLPTVGYQGHQSLYKKPVTGIEHRKDPFFNVNPMRPRLKDRDVRQNEEFATLSAGMQIAMHSTKQREAQQLPDNTKVQIPVVGYTGHRMGYKSQNFYGKNYRDCAIQSKMVQRMAQ